MEKACSLVKSFLEFCSNAKAQLEKFKQVQVVMGNPTCDLDSAVSALVYALLCHEEAKLAGKNNTAVFPLLNIMKSDLCMKTEVIFWMKKNQVPVDLLLSRSDLDLKSLHKSGQLELILVDHHVLSPADSFLQKCIVEIYDHRPPEPGWEWRGKKTLLRVGSCATLIAKEVMQRQPSLLVQDVCLLLYGPILLDTACLSPNAGRTSQLDLDVISELDKHIGYAVKRDEIFQNLLDARSDISSLSPPQLLVKDMKIINGVPICGLPILVQEFVKIPDVKMALEEFCSQRKISTLMIMGLTIVQNVIRRDLAVFSASEPIVGQQLIEHLKKSSSPSLLLEPLHSVIPGLTLFKQGNIKASRKEIVPLVKTATESIEKLGRECKP
ncbi:exopolyphosphatase PRUNE1 [Anabrus simplex]|uniref:exopolyphosphatase PRUNE1 n=1 Tax=Anabrus simplex TaxID=316456 RepID=UPI0035A3A948